METLLRSQDLFTGQASWQGSGNAHPHCAEKRDQFPSPRSLLARWVFPVAGPPLRKAAVTISQGRIVAVGSPPRNVPIEDVGQSAIVPGLVNAHTHLEFSDLAGPIGRPGMGLVEWLGSVIRHRADATDVLITLRRDGNASRRSVMSTVELGLRESIAQGVTTIGEIAQPGGAIDPYLASPCDGTIFLELIAPRVERVEAALNAAAKHVNENRGLATGPESARPLHGPSRTARRAVALSTEHEIPLAMHLAESRRRSISCATAVGRFASCWNRAAAGTPRPGRAALGRWTNFACSRMPIGP